MIAQLRNFYVDLGNYVFFEFLDDISDNILIVIHYYYH